MSPLLLRRSVAPGKSCRPGSSNLYGSGTTRLLPLRDAPGNCPGASFLYLRASISAIRFVFVCIRPRGPARYVVLTLIAASPMASHVTVKGGVVMQQVSGDVRRATRDVDSTLFVIQ